MHGPTKYLELTIEDDKEHTSASGSPRKYIAFFSKAVALSLTLFIVFPLTPSARSYVIGTTVSTICLILLRNVAASLKTWIRTT